MDLKFPGELVDHVVLGDSGLEDLLEGEHGTCGLVSADVYVPEFARTYALT